VKSAFCLAYDAFQADICLPDCLKILLWLYKGLSIQAKNVYNANGFLGFCFVQFEKTIYSSLFVVLSSSMNDEHGTINLAMIYASAKGIRYLQSRQGTQRNGK